MRITIEVARVVSPMYDADASARSITPRLKAQARSLGITPNARLDAILAQEIIPTTRKAKVDTPNGKQVRVVRRVPNASEKSRIRRAFARYLSK